MISPHMLGIGIVQIGWLLRLAGREKHDLRFQFAAVRSASTNGSPRLDRYVRSALVFIAARFGIRITDTAAAARGA